MKQTEQRLIKRLKNGDTDALGGIIDAYSGYVCTVIRNFSRGLLSEQDADELCSDIFFNLWEHRGNLDAEIPLKAYLSTAARNAAKNRFRSQKLPAEDVSELELADDFSVERQAEINELMKTLDEGMKQLPERDCEIFMRFYFYGEKSSEIAKITGIAEGSVRSALSRTRTKLRDYLMKRGFDYV